MHDILNMEESEELPIKSGEYGFAVSHQKVDLDIDFSTQSLKGRCGITILPQSLDLRLIRLDARQCSILESEVFINGVPASYFYEDLMKKMDIPDYLLWSTSQWEMQRDRLQPLMNETRGDGSLIVIIPKKVLVEGIRTHSEKTTPVPQQRATSIPTSKASSAMLDTGSNAVSPNLNLNTSTELHARFQPLVVTISFMTTGFRDGLHFVGLGEGDARFPHVYTRHNLDPGTASCIFPCIDNPSMRCTWDISIRCSRCLGDALKRPIVLNNQRNNQQFKGKKENINSTINPILEDYQVPLSDDEKLLEMIVVCSGELMNETTDLEDNTKKIVSFLCSTVVAPQHIGFAIGPFEQVDLSEFREVEDDDKLGQAQAVPVLGYCLPGHSDDLRHTCTPMAYALDWFIINFGSYPFTECRFVFVDDQIRDVEHAASLSLCSSRLLFRENIIDPELEVIRKLVHAIASQWIGVNIVPNQRCDRWVTIGLSHYITDLFFKILCGNNHYVFRQKQQNDLCVEQDIRRPSLYVLGEILHIGSFQQDFMALKSPLVLSILDRRIVKASRSVGLAKVISKLIMTSNTGTPADSVISTESFRKVTEKITKYRQTESFWNQWILGAGCPSFSITQKFNKKRLCVEMTITQTQDKRLETEQKLENKSFLRYLKEDIKGINAGQIQPIFTGPLTIRIHEADGTPYEHIIELREGHAKIEIPYNTKYKRLKRNRLQKERAAAAEHAGEGGEDALYYCLGDLLTSPAQMREWGLTDWDAEQETSMAQESYEWLRVDADHEWICEKTFTNMKAYMYVSQLQQDRDVAAQYESMMYLKPLTSHPLVATFLVRTLMDNRYFYGIRLMGAEFLKTHATKAHNWVGLHQLQKVYQEFFCYPGTKMSRTNNFTDKRTYNVEKAIVRSLSQIRAKDGTCPMEARHFLLDLLRFNDNTNNEFSDNFKVANLLSALTNTLIPAELDLDNINLKSRLDQDETIIGLEMQLNNTDDIITIADTEQEDFKSAVIQELDRYRRMDEWINSYQNIFTVTVLDCKQRLMKAKVIPIDPIEFVQYLHDGTSDFIRIKASEALVDLGFMSNDYVLKLLMNILSTDPSPYTRNHLFEIICLGFAKIAFGDTKLASSDSQKNTENDATEEVTMSLRDDFVSDAENDGLIIEEDASLEARKVAISRITSWKGASAALKLELKNNEVMKEVLWKAISSSTIGLSEQLDLLDLCRLLYDPILSMTVKLKIPRFWKAENLGKGVILFRKTNKTRTNPLKPLSTIGLMKSNISTGPVRLSISTSSGPKISPTNNSITSKSTPKSAIISSKSFTKVELQTTPMTIKLPTISMKTSSKPATSISLKPFGSVKPTSKRTQEFLEYSNERPRKIVRLKTNNMHKVALIQSRPPNPAISRDKNSSLTRGPTSMPKQPSKSCTDSTPKSSQTHISNTTSPSSKSNIKTRKPLPDTRRPLPGGSTGHRQPLPGAIPRIPRKPLPSEVTTEEPQAKRAFILKLKTSGYKEAS
ncbi:Transcription initiation factor TFIID subunit 2 [Erysiphe necator]|nr:Transcription initiation factor TFIID subunit 2 [Erysiphe necator]